MGTPCWPAGIDAQNYDLGDMWCNDPEDMVNSRYIILWGANPAWNSVHSMKYIYAAQDRGAKVVCSDPVFTQTAAKSDVYWQVDTSMDGALALGMARHILDEGLFDKAWVEENSVGFK
ncbi:MAG: molybdopterin-dependent oxidoreductase [Desulfobacterales bacterium]|nr:molybdopterin-dependent oxidoreductase [Desulfobacterales bacterium]MBS3755628.1 molybdopterin-dependent oxidoreductase [Desulfobacterales bacterium]